MALNKLALLLRTFFFTHLVSGSIGVSTALFKGVPFVPPEPPPLGLLVLLEEMCQGNLTHRPLIVEVYVTLQTIARQTDRATQEVYVGIYLSRDTPTS